MSRVKSETQTCVTVCVCARSKFRMQGVKHIRLGAPAGTCPDWFQRFTSFRTAFLGRPETAGILSGRQQKGWDCPLANGIWIYHDI